MLTLVRHRSIVNLTQILFKPFQTLSGIYMVSRVFNLLEGSTNDGFLFGKIFQSFIKQKNKGFFFSLMRNKLEIQWQN